MPGPKLLLIEDFYEDPEAIRKMAICLPFVALPTFTKLYQSDRSLVSSQTIHALSAQVGHPIQHDENNRTFGVFRAAMHADTNQTNVHHDLHDWAAVLHLSPPSPGISSGTGFFRHRETGLIGPPPGEPPEGELMERIYSDGQNPDAWEMYEFLESKFNRMLIFRGSDYFHDTVGRFGNHLANCRLTQNFFFSVRVT
jgi:hypothetical protein